MAKDVNLSALEAQAAFMRSSLRKQKKALRDQPFVVEYDNGGGQIGTKENPEWTAYEKLMKTYQATLRAIATQQGGVKAREKTTGIGSPLTNYRNKYGSLKVVKDA